MSTRVRGPRAVLFAVLPLLTLLLLAELGLRAVYYQRSSKQRLALAHAVSVLSERYARARAERRLRDELGGGAIVSDDSPATRARIERLHDALYEPAGAALLAEFRAAYAAEYGQLIADVRATGALPITLYVPSGDFRGAQRARHDACRAFFRELSARHGVEHVDATDAFRTATREALTLAPHDAHLSPFGHWQVAQVLQPVLDAHRAHRSRGVHRPPPARLGDLEPGTRTDVAKPELPYVVHASGQGLRRSSELRFPATESRVLVLGDSFTFGPYVHGDYTFAGRLDADAKREVINAGVMGYTISDERSLFEERAQYIAADVVVLQVLDNDIQGFFYFMQNRFDRRRRAHRPTALERAFLDALPPLR